MRGKVVEQKNIEREIFETGIRIPRESLETVKLVV